MRLKIIKEAVSRARAFNLNNGALSRDFFSQEALGRKLNAKVKAATPGYAKRKYEHAT